MISWKVTRIAAWDKLSEEACSVPSRLEAGWHWEARSFHLKLGIWGETDSQDYLLGGTGSSSRPLVLEWDLEISLSFLWLEQILPVGKEKKG